MKRKKMRMIVKVCMVLVVITMGCVHQNPEQASGTTATLSRPANPAVKKCLKDGYVAEPVMENGVPVDYRCINPRTGLECGVWEYYRNECTLSR
jgi:putative hemolysin